MKSGIYFIKRIGGKIYIGSSKNVNNRLSQHFSKLNKNKHGNQKLQNSYNKYGRDVFKTGVLEFCEIDRLVKREQFYIDSYDKEELFNIRLIAESNLGVRHSIETRAKWSEGLKGNQHALGMKHTDEAKAKMSKSRMGNKNLLGKKYSEETKAKMSAARKGIPKSKEHIENMTKAKIGLKRSEESKLKMSQSAKNRNLPEDFYVKRSLVRAANRLKKIELAA